MLTNQIRKCPVHGYFKGTSCPQCGEEGKFILSEEEVDILGRTITKILRHKPEKYHLEIDEHGYVNIDEMVQEIRFYNRRLHFVGPSHIYAVVLTDGKGRYQLSDNKRYLRATYGHTIDVDLSDLPSDGIPEILYYPTSEEEFDILKENGILPSDRRWVHLSSSAEKAYIAGLYHFDSPLLIPIKSDVVLESGEKIYHAGQEVFICKFVPPESMMEPQKFEGSVDEETLQEIKLSKEKKIKARQEGW